LKGFRFLGILPSVFVPGGRAILPSSTCASPKRTLKLLQSVLAGDHGFEEMAQFTVARIGDALLGAVPFEPTTTVGARMRDAMREAAGTTEPPRRVMVLGIANNYIGYVPTLLEYPQQYYEGGSALYGPASARVYTEQLAGLTRALAAAGWTSPKVEVPAFPSFASNPASLVPFRWGTPPGFAPTDLRLRTRDGRPELRWEDDEPGWVLVHRPRVVVVERFQNGDWMPVAGDGTLDLEIRWLRDRSGGRAEWSALWVAPAGTGRFRFRVIDPGRPHDGATAEFTR
jgi:neutral ceramidase